MCLSYAGGGVRAEESYVYAQCFFFLEARCDLEVETKVENLYREIRLQAQKACPSLDNLIFTSEIMLCSLSGKGLFGPDTIHFH